ncbi:hypothetical protein BT96DRAFT_988204 [Gymnopus androsaceus JB14]|uniref:Uncharacterized protein n=1 Tax=Gymnopus androsaceus JB14 TaxID=1447944 RepID=A0A6A4I759_9AGAR|nr:hypothetical protein BT96DRAFT_988204 [Gymnopus androsaceus JB14]
MICSSPNLLLACCLFLLGLVLAPVNSSPILTVYPKVMKPPGTFIVGYQHIPAAQNDEYKKHIEVLQKGHKEKVRMVDMGPNTIPGIWQSPIVEGSEFITLVTTTLNLDEFANGAPLAYETLDKARTSSYRSTNIISYEGDKDKPQRLIFIAPSHVETFGMKFWLMTTEDFKTVSDFKAVDWTSIKSHVVDWPRDVPFA